MGGAMSDPLVDATWIAAHLQDPGLRLVEVDVSRAAYDEGHIDGAVFWNAYSDLRDPVYQPVGRAQFADLVKRSGIDAESTVVVYGYGAALGFWLLKANGYADVRMLDGSRAQWEQAGEPWSTALPSPPTTTASLPAEASDVSATREAVARAIDDPTKLLLDVRSDLEYAGERFWPSGATEGAGRPGHVPGATSLPIDRLRTEDGALKPSDELQLVFERAGVTKDKGVITYCTIGNRASLAWFALKYVLGYPDVRVYYGSWVDWGKRTDTPIEAQGPTIG
jgi:thiosulfate/3-mercaptopyruvate sulfurtransferase